MQDVGRSTMMKALILVCLIGFVLSLSLGDKPKHKGEEEKHVAQDEQANEENDKGNENRDPDHTENNGLDDSKETSPDEEYLVAQGEQDEQHNQMETEEEEGYYGYKEHYTDNDKTASDDNDDYYDDDGYNDLYDAYYDDNEALDKEGYDDDYDDDDYYDDYESHKDESYKEHHTDQQQQWDKHGGQQEEKDHNEKESDHSSKKETPPEGYGYHDNGYYDDRYSNDDDDDDDDYGYHDSVYDDDSYAEEKRREEEMQRKTDEKRREEEMSKEAERKKEAEKKEETGREKQQTGQNEETNIGGSQSGSQNDGGSAGLAERETGDNEGPANQRDGGEHANDNEGQDGSSKKKNIFSNIIDKRKSNTDSGNKHTHQQNTDGNMQNNRGSNLHHNTNNQHNTDSNNQGKSSPNSDDDTNLHGKSYFNNQGNKKSNSHHNRNHQDNHDSRDSNSQGNSNLNSLDNKNSKANSNNNARDNRNTNSQDSTNSKNKQNANLQSNSNTNAQANRNVNTQENRNANAQTDQNDNMQNNGNANAQMNRNANLQNNRNINTQDDRNANAQMNRNANAQNNRNVNTQDNRNANAHTNGNANAQNNRNANMQNNRNTNIQTNRNANAQDDRNANTLGNRNDNAQNNRNTNIQTNRNANAQNNRNANTQNNRNTNIQTNRNANAQDARNANTLGNRNDNAQNNRNTNLAGAASDQQKKTSKTPQPPASSKLSGKLMPSKKKDFDKSFGSASVSSFDGQKFDSNGGLTDSFKRTLKPSTQEILNKFDRLFPNVIDYRGTFRTLRTESLIGFISRFTNQFQENREVFDTFFTSPANLISDNVKKIPLEFLASLKTSILTEKMSQVDLEVKDRLCMNLGNNDISSTSTRKLLQVLDCSNWLARTSMCRNPISNVLAKDFEEQHKTRSTLTDNQCQDAVEGLYFCALSKKTIRKCSIQFLYSNLQKLGSDSTVIQYVFKLVFSSDEHTVARLMAEHILPMKGKLKYLKAAYVKKINKHLIISALDLFALEAASMDTAAKKVIGKYIVETKNLGDLTGQDLLNVIPFIPCNKKTLRQLNTDAIIAVMDQIKTLEIDKKCKMFFAEKNPDLQDKTTIDNDKFKDNKKFLKGLTPNEVQEMNLDYEELLNEGELIDFEVEDETSGRAVLDKVFEAKKPKDLTKNDIKNLGKSLLVTIQVKDIKQCDKTAFTEGFLDAVDEDPDISITIEGPSVQEILEMMVEVTGIVIDAIGDLFKQMPAKMLTDKQDESFGDMSGDTKRNVSCEPEQCSYLFDAFKEEKGPPDLENSNYTQEAVQNMGDIMTGMTVSDIKDLPPTDCSTICLLITLEMNDHQLTSLVDKLKYIFGLMDVEGDVAGSVTTEDIEQCGTALTMFSVDDIERLPTNKKTVALKTIAQTNLTEVSQEKIDAFARLLQELLGKESGALSLDDIEELGYLVCGLPVERYDDIEDNAVFDKLVLDNCPPLTQEKCKKFMKAVKRKYKKGDLDSLDEEIILDIGECVVELDNQDLDQISDDVMEEIEEEIIKSVEKNERKSKRKEKGMTKKEKEEKKTRQKKVKSKVVEAKIRNKQRSSTRSRRSVATTLTCEEMKLLGSGITASTTAQITAMSDNDFLDCASMFGKYSEWTNNQITALLDVATRSGTFNVPSQWTADHLESAGIITQGLTPSELSTLNDLTVDAMYAMGRHDGWSELQLQAGFSRWLELNGGLSRFITSTDLVALGHFACGASTDHIDQMNATEYSLAAKHIGELTSCLEHQLESYAMLAKDIHAFGNVSTWSTSIVASVGNVIGGLSATELGSFSTDQLAMVLPETIALIPSSAFVGFTPNQLASLSLAQSNAVTQNQQAGLSGDQLLALAEAGATLYSAAHCLMIPVIMTFIPLVMAYIFHL